MRVLMLVSSPFITDPRVYNEARTLVKAGYGVTVVAWDREKNTQVRQELDGIDIFRLRIPVPFKYGVAKVPWHTLHLASWQCEVYRKSLGLNRQTPFSFIHCNFLDTLPVGIALKRKLKVPLVYDSRDIYGYMMQATFPVWIASMFSRMEKRLIAKADRIIVVNEPMKCYFEGIENKPITIIMNCKELVNQEYQPTGNSKLTLLYIGTLHRTRPLERLLNVVKELPGVACIIGGIGQPEYIRMLQEEASRSDNISFIGRVPFDEVLTLTQRSDAVFYLLEPSNMNYRIATPNKLFEAMVCGRPIICTRGTYCGEFVEREEIGLAVDYDEDTLRDAIIRLRDDPELRERLGRNALRAAITKYNWQREEEKLLELYAALESKLKSH